MDRELHLAIDPSAFRRFIIAHWSKISLWLIKSTMKASNPMVNDEATKVTK